MMSDPDEKIKGYVRVTNMRVSMAPESQPEEDETVIRVDRENKILGNRHVLRDKSDLQARHAVISANQADLEKDCAHKGPMFQALVDIATRVKAGEKICLACWCDPSPCHATNYVKKINQLIKEPHIL